jgi:hypothetical protein
LAKERLTHEDHTTLTTSWITPEIANEAGLYRVDSVEGGEIVGQRHRDCAGIVFPYLLPGVGVVSNRIRRDNPDIEYRGERRVQTRRYLGETQGRNHFYYTPGTSLAALSDADLPIAIVEGEKKALALHRLATYGSPVARRFLPIGLAGVFGWKGVREIVENAKGQRQPAKGPLADFDRIIWPGRTVYIVFDTNAQTNDQVRWARVELTKELAARGARVIWVTIPETEGVNGIDDFLFRCGADATLELFGEADIADPAAECRRIVSTADPLAILDAAPILAVLSDTEYAKVKTSLPKGMSRRDLDRAVKEAKAKREREVPQKTEDRPMIMTTGRHMRDVTAESLQAVVASNVDSLATGGNDPAIFQQDGALFRVRKNEADRPNPGTGDAEPTPCAFGPCRQLCQESPWRSGRTHRTSAGGRRRHAWRRRVGRNTAPRGTYRSANRSARRLDTGSTRLRR